MISQPFQFQMINITLNSTHFCLFSILISSRIGAVFLMMNTSKHERRTKIITSEKSTRQEHVETYVNIWGGEGPWRLSHRFLGLLVLALGFTNISLGVFLAVLPLAVWIIWYIYLGFILLAILLLEVASLIRNGCTGRGKSYAAGSGKPNKSNS